MLISYIATSQYLNPCSVMSSFLQILNHWKKTSIRMFRTILVPIYSCTHLIMSDIPSLNLYDILLTYINRGHPTSKNITGNYMYALCMNYLKFQEEQDYKHNKDCDKYLAW